MNSRVDFAYAQARLQARYGALPDDAAWQRLHGSRTLAHFMQSARATPLRPWLLNLGPHSGIHEIESALRHLFRHEVAAVADWLPAPWREAVRWVAPFADLPALEALLRGDPVQPWMHEDQRLRPFTQDLPALRIQALENSEFAPLLPSATDSRDLPAAWRHRWRALWPPMPAEWLRALEKLESEIAAQPTAMASTLESAPLREQLERRLRRIFRNQHHRPAAAFAYLALVALQLERLRGALIQRALFPPKREPHAA